MVITNFKVQKRKVSQIDSIPYTGEYNIDTFKFEFDDEWEGLDKTLVIVSGNRRYNVPLLNNECVVPFEFYQIKGTIEIGLFGTDGEYRTLATGWLPLYVEEDTYEVNVEPENLPTPTQWDLYVTEINRLLELAQATEQQCEDILSQLTNDYNAYVAEMNQIKADTQLIKEDVDGLKSDTQGLKNDVESDIQEFNSSYQSKVSTIDQKYADYNNNATEKTNAFNSNASNKTSTYNSNATSKTNTFNQNVTDKTTAFNQNYTEKIGAITEAGTEAVGNVQSAEDTAIENIEQAGESYDVRINQLLNQIPVGTVLGESINVQDSSDLPFKDIEIKGKTTQDGTPTPSNPVSINVVTGDVTVNLRTKNLFNASTGQNGYVNDSGSVVSRNYQYASDYIELSEGDYTISGSIVFSNIGYALYDKNKSILLPREDNKNKQSVTVSITNQKYIRFWIDVGNTSGITLNANNVTNTYKVQCEKGSTATAYEPYQEQSQLLSLGNMELCKIGNYQDYIYKSGNKFYKHKVINKALYNGSENWFTSSESGGIYQYNVNRSEAIYVNNSTVYVISDQFNGVIWNNSWTKDNSITVSYNTSGNRFRVMSSTISTLEDFKQYLSTHNLTVYYVLATPIEEEITDTTLLSQLNALYELQTFKNVTNMYTTTQNELPTLNVTYRKDLQTLTDKIVSLDARLSLLE